MIIGKSFNSRWVIERTTRDHSMRVDVEKLKTASQNIKNNICLIEQCCSLEELRGIEGNAAACYFSVLDEPFYKAQSIRQRRYSPT